MRNFFGTGFIAIAVLSGCASSPQPGTQSMANSIVVGRDQTAWIAVPAADKIIRVGRNGAVMMLALAAESEPTSLVLGPDGNYWFVEKGRNRIARVSSTGALTEYAVPDSDAGLTKIVSSPLGHLWFIESHANKIGFISTTGIVREFPIDAQAQSIATTADGDVVVTGKAIASMIRISPQGTMRKYPLR